MATEGSNTPDVPLQSRIVDDKSPICVPFILERLAAYEKQQQQQEASEKEDASGENTAPHRPFFIGLNGIQGVGKTTLVRALATALDRADIESLVLSIDDFYLPHAELVALSNAHPANELIQVRGEPGTHDTALLCSVMEQLARGESRSGLVRLPTYDKAAHGGRGDRVATGREEEWRTTTAGRDVRVVILEGWCVGFRALDDADLRRRVDTARATGTTRTLFAYRPEDFEFVNTSLRAYEPAWDVFDAFVHIDAADLMWVYDWRLEQEAALRKERGQGMDENQVIRFVNCYYPAYELFLEGVRRGVFQGRADRVGCQLRLIVRKNRSVQESMVI